MRIIVLGAGLLGLTTAWFLRRAGAEVVVLERAAGPGLETSFANGGMLHASQASPWNEPGVLRQALAMLGDEDAALLIRPRALLGMLPWAWQFFRQSRPRAFVRNLAKNARLAAYSLRVLHAEFGDLAPAYAQATCGTLKVYRTPAELERAQAMAERCRAYAVDYRVLDADGVIRLEPALAPIETALAGGIHFPADVAGDAHLFCRVLAAHAADAGVRFRFESEVRRVHLRQGRFHALEHDGLVESADACVIAAGASSPRLLRPLGIALPVQPVKGYSLTVPFDSWTPRPRVPVIDEHFHAAACPLGAALRIAGTAEFAGFDTTLNPARLENLYRLLAHLYPEGAARVERRDVVHWSGLRPMSPDGVGIMGRTAVTGLYVNTGHGHLGWTMAPGAGKLVAQQVLDVDTDLAGEDYALARFR